MPQRRDISERQQRTIMEKYQAGVGLRAIADGYNYALSVIRRVLVENNVPIRHRGRPRKVDER